MGTNESSGSIAEEASISPSVATPENEVSSTPSNEPKDLATSDLGDGETNFKKELEEMEKSTPSRKAIYFIVGLACLAAVTFVVYYFYNKFKKKGEKKKDG